MFTDYLNNYTSIIIIDKKLGRKKICIILVKSQQLTLIDYLSIITPFSTLLTDQ